MLYVIGFANLLLGIITFVYLFAGTERVTSFLYLSMLSSIVLNILFFVLIRKEGEKILFIKNSFLYSSCCLAISSYGFLFSHHRAFIGIFAISIFFLPL